ncbi:MAG: sugar ABC transporter substrate-binding protein [Coriobacteriia bacterium]|nr:sugar ABC transporter substrate-binding protein [Coriobacteriia bacterium]
MSKVKKLSLLFVSALFVLVLAGCANKSNIHEIPEPVTDNSKIKIGVSIWSSTDVLGAQSKKIIDYAADILGVQVIYIDQGHVSEKVVSSVEQLCAAGCQGVVICNSSATEMISAIKTCNDYGMYISQFYRTIKEQDDPESYTMAKESPFYVGAVHENEVENGKKLVKMLADKNRRNIGLIGWTQGDATWLGRWEGYKAGVEEWNTKHPNDKIKLSEPQYAGTTSDGGSSAAEALISADPKIDALIPAGGGGDPLLGAVAAVERLGLVGKVDIVSTDFLADLGERLENKTMAGESGGHFCDPLISFLLVYNTIKGNYSNFENKFVDIEHPYIYVSSSEDYAKFEKYFIDQPPYNRDEIIEMSNMTLDELKNKSMTVSLEDAERRAQANENKQ